MQKCNNCGSEFEGNYCDYCGMPADTQTQGYTEIPQYDTNFMRGDSINQNYSYTTPNSEQPTTTLGWIGWQLLEAFLPLIGLIIMLIFSEDETVKNYAKARLILSLVAIVIAVIIFALFSALIFSLIRNIA